jgi:hypothetical protein
VKYYILQLKVYFFIFLFFWGFLEKNQRFRGGNWQKWAWNFRG